MAIPRLPIEHRAERLAQVVQAYTLTEDMPASTKTNLRNHVRGIVLLTKAQEWQAVAECVTALRNTIRDGLDQSVVDWPKILVRRCDDVLRLAKAESS
jgi:hypothetical protein